MTEAEVEALAAEHEDLLGFFYMCPVGVLKMDGAGTVQMMNPQASQLLMAVARAPAIGNLFDLLEPFAPELRNLVESFKPSGGRVCDGHRLFIGRGGRGPGVLSCTLLKVDAGCLVALLSDVTAQVEQERRLRQTESWFTALLAGVKDFALFTLDPAGRIDSWNSSSQMQTGFAEGDVIGHTMHRFYHADENRQGRAAEQIDCATREGWHLDEGWCVRRDGSRYWSQILVTPIQGDDGANGFSVVLRDITERHMTGQELRRLLTTDHLTGAVNRAHFDELAEREVARRRRYGGPLSLILLDIDHFKRVNDTFGHPVGDRVLQGVVASCRTQLRSTDVLARLGGEEFVVLLPGIDRDGAAGTAERLRRTVARDLAVLRDDAVGVTVSLGCAEMADVAGEWSGLLKTADEALYRAKRLGRNRVELHVPPSCQADSGQADSGQTDSGQAGTDAAGPGALQLAEP